MAAPDDGGAGAGARLATTRLLFVCLGNICRSPTAEGVMRSLVERAGLSDRVELDSAGTGAWHVGSAPDRRASEAADARGVALDGTARQVRETDFEEFDLLIAMDRANARDLRALAHGEDQRSKVRLLREFDAASAASGDLDVPDPYYGAGDGFAEVFDLVRSACQGLLSAILAGELPVSLPAGASVVTRIGGGDINEAFRVRMADGGEAFVKTRADPAPGEYAAEAAGLAWLAEPGALRTPRVLDIGERYLALEWINPGRLSSAGAEELGRGLAETHLAGAPCFGREAGADGPALFGSLRLSNEPTGDWPSFYAQRRLAPLTALARERGVLSDAAIAAVERVCARMGELSGPPEPPSRLHGDLWSGNVMADEQGRAWLIDPSAYGGQREVDLAMLRLFGAPSERVLGAYAELAPPADGWRDRVELYQLLPLLVHALLFGGSYAVAVERVALRYAA